MDRYRLAPLRDVRARDERTKRQGLASAVGDARTTAADVAVAEQRVADARAALVAAMHTKVTSSHLLALADRHVAHRRRQLDGAIAALATARAAHAGKLTAIDASRTALTAARADKEIIERHFARWREAQQKRAERREE